MKKVEKISNKNSSEFVANKVEFQANNMFSVNITSPYDSNYIYAVYSYGLHFPMFVYFNGFWYENSDKYSVTTSKQQTQARPQGVKICGKNTAELKELIENCFNWEYEGKNS